MRRVVWPLLVVLALGGCGVGGGDAVVSPTAAVARDAARSTRSEAVLSRLLRADLPGCSAAVGVRGTVVWAGARGVADLATGEQLVPDTVFDIASVSKQFTATAILLLAGDGKLSIGDTVAEHLSGLPEWAGRVTVAELMRHTSGIPDNVELLRGRGYSLSQRVTQAQIVREVAAVPVLRFAPGQRFEYSGSNYVLLAEIVRGVSGTALPPFLRERIFGPLGLDMVLDPDGMIAGK
jgi:CubicO group peptidase (beta-lactamase class C family)